MPVPAAGAAAAAARGGGGRGGPRAGTGALAPAPAPGAQFAHGRRRLGLAAPRAAQWRGVAVPDGEGGLEEPPGLQPSGKEFAHLLAPHRPSPCAAVLFPQRHPRLSCPPQFLGHGRAPKFLESVCNDCFYTLNTDHLSLLSATGAKTLTLSEFKTNAPTGKYWRFEKLFWNSSAPRSAPRNARPPLVPASLWLDLSTWLPGWGLSLRRLASSAGLEAL